MLWNSDRNIDVVAAQSAIGDFRLVITIIRMTGLWLRWTGGFMVRRMRSVKESQRPDLPMIIGIMILLETGKTSLSWYKAPSL